MIARLLISSSFDLIKQTIAQTLALHLPGGSVNNPDLLYFPRDSKLGIMEARKIKGHFSLKPYEAKGRAVVIEEAANLTIEAQNALLKILEELPKEALLILGASSETKLLPTILSRCQIIRVKSLESRVKEENNQENIEQLLKISIQERFEFVEKLKDKEEFLKSLIHYFHQNLNIYSRNNHSNFLKELLQAEQWEQSNVNLRAILEYLMLVIPPNS